MLETNDILCLLSSTHLDLVFLSDNSVTKTLIQFWNCIDVGSDRILANYPDVSCVSDPDYLRYYPLMVALLILVVIGWPLCCLALLFYGHRTEQLHNTKSMFFRRVSILYEVYSDKFVFWVRSGFCWPALVLACSSVSPYLSL